MSSFLDNIPGAAPPPGQHSDFNAPSPLLGSTYGLNIVLVVLMLSIVTVRFYVRGKLLHSLGIDDYFCLLAAVGSFIHTVLVLNAFQYGFGKHLWDIRATALLNPSNLRKSNATQIVYPIAIYAIKLSVLLLYKRVFSVDKPLKKVINGTIIVLSVLYAMYLGFAIASVVQCVDLESLFNDLVCVNMWDILLAQGIVNVVSDVFILVLPFKAIQQLQMNKRQKLGVMAIFGAGLLTCIMSLTRCIFLAITYKLGDSLYDGCITSHFTAVEINIAIIASCAPAIPAFVTRVRQVGSTVYRSLLNRTTTRSGWSMSGQDTSATGPAELYSGDNKSFNKAPYPTVNATYEMRDKRIPSREKINKSGTTLSEDESTYEGILKTVSISHNQQNRF